MSKQRFIGNELYLVLCILCVSILCSIEPAAAAPPIHYSVKIRVDSTHGHDWGTGTIIDTRIGPNGQEALILTCGHIFRESKGEENIEVHLFGENSTVKVFGKCLHYDLEIDLALVAISTPGPVQAVPIAPPSYTMQPYQQAWSVGCDHGGHPTVKTHQIMSVDRISTPRENRVPFHYVQVSNAPVSGRSGGGLYSSEGYLIGVCNTGGNDGLFVPPHMIRYLLDSVNLAHIHQNPSLGTAAVQAPPIPAALTALTPLTPLTPVLAMSEPMYAENRMEMSLKERATLEEVERYRQDGNEVIVIIRSKRNPDTPSDVIVLNDVSNQFLDTLVTRPATHNQVILSSQEKSPQPVRQAVSFPVRY